MKNKYHFHRPRTCLPLGINKYNNNKELREAFDKDVDKLYSELYLNGNIDSVSENNEYEEYMEIDGDTIYKKGSKYYIYNDETSEYEEVDLTEEEG